MGQIREQMASVDQVTTLNRAYAHSRVAIRTAADLTQVEFATQMGVTIQRSAGSRKRHDTLLSTLTTLLSAASEHPRVVVTVNGQDVELGLATMPGGP